MKIACLGLSMALLFMTGCANKPDVISGTEELNPLISSSYAAADRLLTPSAKQELLRKDKRVLVASWVDVNQVSRSSIFGKCGSRFKFKQKKILKILVSFPQLDPDPADQNRCGSVRIRIRISNTVSWIIKFNNVEDPCNYFDSKS
jgi:hypothetical protein